MHDMVALLAGFSPRFTGQPTPLQAIVVLGALALRYPLPVVARLLASTPHGPFRGLGKLGRRAPLRNIGTTDCASVA